jgi:endonuclease YncB( thermonuclease family)
MRPLLLALVLLVLPARAAEPPEIPAPLEPGAPGEVVEVVDGDTLFLDDGREVRLVGLQAPKLPLGRPDFEAWPLSDDAKAALAELALGRTVWPAFGGLRRDRHGRVLAHLIRDDGLWLQAELLERGLARVYSFPDNRALVDRMLRHERRARAAARGIWDHPFYAVRTEAEVRDLTGSFQLVEGRVADVAEVRGRVYINFGRNWRTDFTVTIPPDAVARFTDAGLDPEVYDDHRIRVRGWVEDYNGPLIEADHPEQIERLDR